MRRIVSAVLVVAVVALLVGAAAAREISWEAGVSVGVSSSLFFLALLLDYVATLSSENGIRIFANEDAALDAQQQYIRAQTPRSVQMYEYSGHTVSRLFTELGNCASLRDLKLLLHDPRTAPDWQRDFRILPVIATLPVSFQMLADANVEIRCYSHNASFRGRNYDGKLIAAGWYTYERREGRGEKERLWGGQNAVVIAPTDNPSGAALRRTLLKYLKARGRRLFH